MINKPELLSPAGSPEALRTALRFGADAVYLGGPFMQLRAAQVAVEQQHAVSRLCERDRKI